MKLLFIYIILFTSLLSAEEYQMGHGVKVNESLYLGGYFSFDYQQSDEKKQFRLDDVAGLAYGSIGSKFSYLVELESAPTYVKNFTTNESKSDLKFHYERMYMNYMHSDMLNIRVGKQITPIGYWNLEPINVLRDTSSNPLYASQVFPKLFTGLDFFGYLNSDNTLKYHLFMQRNKDLDKNYINIENEHFFGASMEYESSDEFSFGGALGEFIAIKDNQRVRFAQLNAKYDDYPFLLQAEVASSNVDDERIAKKSTKIAGYTQGKYNLDMKHSLISRYEYFNDHGIGLKEHIGVFGYSYRPLYSVSFKAEYQWNSDTKKNKSIVSFSVLF